MNIIRSKTITITPPEGYVVDKDNSTFDKITFKEISEEPKLPESRTDIEKINGFFVDTDSIISETGELGANSTDDYNVFATKNQAKASLALSQITQLLKIYNEDWVADWTESSPKFVITFRKEAIIPDSTVHNPFLLAFRTEQERDHFKKHHLHLIKEAAPLLAGESW